jgi:uncharacterized protein DUF3105
MQPLRLRPSSERLDSRALVWLGLALLVAPASVACGDGSDTPASPAAGAGGGSGSGAAGSGGTAGSTGVAGTLGASDAGNVVTGGDCDVNVIASPPTSADHLTLCSDVSYDTNPPSGGAHYAIWPAFQTYDFPLPAGVLVHALEHGAIVFWYNCPEGCPDEVAEVEAFIAAEPADPLCVGTPAARRAVLVPYPELATRWAASSWGYALTADCFDPEAFGAFYTDHYGRGRESLCNAGQAYTQNPCP